MIILAWISWKICFKMCKLWFLQHCYNISKQDFFKSAQWGTKIYQRKNITMFLCSKCHESDMTPLSAQSNPAVAAWISVTKTQDYFHPTHLDYGVFNACLRFMWKRFRNSQLRHQLMNDIVLNCWFLPALSLVWNPDITKSTKPPPVIRVVLQSNNWCFQKNREPVWYI